ncbi:MAG: 30S ribosomal protein S6 [Phycisphaerae bacterium]|nr:30S ribosomal protein S6 [Phycisphaerae bacterium]
MTTSKGRSFNYEAMFLLSQSVAADLGGAVEHLKSIINKSGATLIAMRKWDERRLAYEIDKQKRGTYILAYFSCDPVKVSQVERDCNLSEQILRTLILRVDHLSVEEMQAADGQRELETEAALRRARATEPAAVATAEPAPAEPSEE